MLQTTYRENHLTKQRLINNGELPKYHVEESHEAIITLETFETIQAEMKLRAAKHYKGPSKRPSYPFTGILVCGNCGKRYRRKVTKAGVVWICGTLSNM